jgi:hypothetical protein
VEEQFLRLGVELPPELFRQGESLRPSTEPVPELLNQVKLLVRG